MVVDRLCYILTTHIRGVHRLAGESQTSGVSVEVGQEEAAIDLTMTVEYGKFIPQLAEAVRNYVTSRVESLVGLRVTEANITVQNVFFPGEKDQGQQQAEG